MLLRVDVEAVLCGRGPAFTANLLDELIPLLKSRVPVKASVYFEDAVEGFGACSVLPER